MKEYLIDTRNSNRYRVLVKEIINQSDFSREEMLSVQKNKF